MSYKRTKLAKMLTEALNKTDRVGGPFVVLRDDLIPVEGYERSSQKMDVDIYRWTGSFRRVENHQIIGGFYSYTTMTQIIKSKGVTLCADFKTTNSYDVYDATGN